MSPSGSVSSAATVVPLLSSPWERLTAPGSSTLATLTVTVVEPRPWWESVAVRVRTCWAWASWSSAPSPETDIWPVVSWTVKALLPVME